MNTLLAARAGWAERSRRFSFWALVASALFASFLFVPKSQGTFRMFIVQADVYRQASNPTWIPIAAAMALGLFLPLIGFAYLKNQIGEDRKNGVLGMLLSGPLPRAQYLFGKFLSGLLALLAVVAAVMLGSALMVVLNFPGQFVAPWAFLSPFLALVPGLAFTAALALLAETVPLLRGQGWLAILGFLVLLIWSVVTAIDPTAPVGSNPLHFLDIGGYRWLMGSVYAAAAATGGPRPHNITVLGGGDWISSAGTLELTFHGIPLTPVHLAQCGALLLFSLLLVFAAALLLERRPLRTGQRTTRRARRAGTPAAHPAGYLPVRYTSVQPGGVQLPRLLWAEGVRLLKNQPLVWLAAQLGVWVACWFVPQSVGTGVLLPLTFALFMPALAQLGSAEKQSGVFELLRCIPGAPLRQLWAQYAAAAGACLVLCAPVALRTAAGLPATALAVAALALLVPALAQLLGGFTRGQRAFQLLLIVGLYVLLNMPEVFLPHSAGAAMARAGVYLLLAAACLAAGAAQCLRAQR